MLSTVNSLGFNKNFKAFGCKNEFIEHNSVSKQFEYNGITVEAVMSAVNNFKGDNGNGI